jgi:hypothetical protein
VFDRSRCDVKEAREVDGDQGVEVLEGVVREGLADVDAGVVDQGVDPAKALDRLVDDALGGVRVGEVAWHDHDPRVRRGLDGSSGCDHVISELTVCPRDTRADALRSAGDDRDLPVVVRRRRDHSTR